MKFGILIGISILVTGCYFPLRERPQHDPSLDHPHKFKAVTERKKGRRNKY